MGSFFSYLWWGGVDPDAINPQSGLSKRDIYNVRTSWTKVSADGIGSGGELLVRLFTAHPNYKNHFITFKDVETENLKKNKQFQAHSLSIITSITNMIDNLEKPDLVLAMCKKLGISHNRHHIKQDQFNHLKDIIVDLFVKDLQFSEATMASWVKVITLMYTNIFKEFK